MGYQGSQYISTTLPGKWVLFDWKLSLNLSLEIMAQVVPVPGAIEDGVSGEKLFLSKKKIWIWFQKSGGQQKI